MVSEPEDGGRPGQADSERKEQIMRSPLKTTIVLLVLLPLPVLHACSESPTDIGKAVTDSKPVTQEMTRLLLSPEILNLKPGQSAQLEVLLERRGPDLGPPDLEVVWSSSDPGVVSVSSNGEVTAHWEGDAMVSARHGIWRAEAKVSVTVDSDLIRDFRG
jgi:uncharacterized protein YjdB